MGGVRSQTLSLAARNLWDRALSRGIDLSAVHLPGVQNVIADEESRTLQSLAEWMPERSICGRVMHLLGQCSVDLFATHLNNQLRRYTSWHPDPFAIPTDAFHGRKKSGRCFCQKICHEKCAVVLIALCGIPNRGIQLSLTFLVQSPLLLPPHK